MKEINLNKIAAGSRQNSLGLEEVFFIGVVIAKPFGCSGGEGEIIVEIIELLLTPKSSFLWNIRSMKYECNFSIQNLHVYGELIR